MDDLITQADIPATAKTDNDFVELSRKLHSDIQQFIETHETVDAIRHAITNAEILAKLINGHIQLESAAFEASQECNAGIIRLKRQLGIIIREMQDNGQLAKAGKPHSKRELEGIKKFADIDVSHQEYHRLQGLIALSDQQFEDQLRTAFENEYRITLSMFAAHGHNTEWQTLGSVEVEAKILGNHSEAIDAILDSYRIDERSTIKVTIARKKPTVRVTVSRAKESKT